jgi:hypothetical protein
LDEALPDYILFEYTGRPLLNCREISDTNGYEHHVKVTKKSARQWRAQFSPHTHFDPSHWMIFYKEIRLAEIYIFKKRYTSCRGSRDNLVADDRSN